jgi:prevent-host-death family protein
MPLHVIGRLDLDHCMAQIASIRKGLAMDVPVSDAKSQLTDLVRRAKAGEDVVLTRHGQPAVRLVPVRPKATPERRWAVMEAVRSRAGTALPSADAAHSQDFLYDPDTGLPG